MNHLPGIDADDVDRFKAFEMNWKMIFSSSSPFRRVQLSKVCLAQISGSQISTLPFGGNEPFEKCVFK